MKASDNPEGMPSYDSQNIVELSWRHDTRRGRVGRGVAGSIVSGHKEVSCDPTKPR